MKKNKNPNKTRHHNAEKIGRKFTADNPINFVSQCSGIPMVTMTCLCGTVRVLDVKNVPNSLERGCRLKLAQKKKKLYLLRGNSQENGGTDKLQHLLDHCASKVAEAGTWWRGISKSRDVML